MLSSTRRYDMNGAPEPLAWSEIDRYAARHHLDDFQRFETLVMALDQKFCELRRNKLSVERKKEAAKAASAARKGGKPRRRR